jgi:hypothetical protein
VCNSRRSVCEQGRVNNQPIEQTSVRELTIRQTRPSESPPESLIFPPLTSYFESDAWKAVGPAQPPHGRRAPSLCTARRLGFMAVCASLILRQSACAGVERAPVRREALAVCIGIEELQRPRIDPKVGHPRLDEQVDEKNCICQA